MPRYAFLVLFCLATADPSLASPEPPAPRSLAGRIEILVADDFAQRRAWEVVLLREEVSGAVYRLEFPAGRPAALRSGDRVVLAGSLAGGALRIESVRIEPPAAARAIEATPSALVAGALRSVVLIVDLADAAVVCPAAQIAAAMYTGAGSVDAFFQEASFDLVSFPGDTDQNGQPDVFGPFAIAAGASPCDPYGWADAADAAAQAAGVDLSLYGFKFYVLPGDSACPWSGLGIIGDPNQITPTSCSPAFQCKAFTRACDSGYVYAHELGHNLGMFHSSQDLDHNGVVDAFGEYGDLSDVMGCCRMHQMNAPHKDVMGWVAPVQVAASGTFALAPLEGDPAATPHPQVLKVRDLYYVSYRQPVGFDATLEPPYSEATSIHRLKGLYWDPDPPFDVTPNRAPLNTLWQAALGDGEPFVDTDNGVTIRQLSHATDQATVEVTLVEPPGRWFHTVAPCRWFDTRSDFFEPWPLLSGVDRFFRVAGRCGVPAGARALSVNVTVTEPSGAGLVTFYPAHLQAAGTSTINFAAGQTRANNAILLLSNDGAQATGVVPFVAGAGQLHLIIDINGYFE